MKIDTTFNFYSDSNGKDPDSYSLTLKQYHKLLWSKTLPKGKKFTLTDVKRGEYLYHNSEVGEFFLGSDAITHSYKYHNKKKELLQQIPNEVNELFDAGSTIGGYIIFPNNRIDNKHTINQARGSLPIIDDRFDLTLECIRMFYSGLDSPLFNVLNRYKPFFDLFGDFTGYVDFFLLNDLVDNQENVKFYLPFDNFAKKPRFNSTDEYLYYKSNVMSFIQARNRRIEEYSKTLLTN